MYHFAKSHATKSPTELNPSQQLYTDFPVSFVKAAIANKARRKKLGLDEQGDNSAETKADDTQKTENTQKNDEKKSAKNKNQNG